METSTEERLTPAERALMAAAGPTYIEVGSLETPGSALAQTVDPDDWRLFYLMRELPEPDRGRVLAFAELLFNLRHAKHWAEGVRERGPGPDGIVAQARRKVAAIASAQPLVAWMGHGHPALQQATPMGQRASGGLVSKRAMSDPAGIAMMLARRSA